MKMPSEVGKMDKAFEECRACLQSVEGKISLELFRPWPFHWRDKETIIGNDLAELTNIEISESDSYSKVICLECINRLQDALSFTVMVQKSDAWLKENDRLDDNSKIDRPPPNVGRMNWPQPINIDQHFNGQMDKVQVEVKQEVLSEDEIGLNDTENMWQDPVLDIKVEPEEMVAPDIAVEISGSYSLEQGEDVPHNTTCEEPKPKNVTSISSKKVTNTKKKSSKYSTEHKETSFKRGINKQISSKNGTSDERISSKNSTCEKVYSKNVTNNVIAASDSDDSCCDEEYLDMPSNKTVKEETMSDDSCSNSDTLAEAVECILCMKKFIDLSRLKAHVLSDHSYKGVKRKTDVESDIPVPVNRTQARLVHLCVYCRRTFRTRSALTFHMRSHDRHSCEGCDVTFGSFTELTRHRRRCRLRATLPAPRTPPSNLLPKVRVLGNIDNPSKHMSEEKQINCENVSDNLVEEKMASLFGEIDDDKSELASLKTDGEFLGTINPKIEPTTEEMNEQTKEIERVLSTDCDDVKIESFPVKEELKDGVLEDEINQNMEVHLEINPILDNSAVLGDVQNLDVAI